MPGPVLAAPYPGVRGVAGAGAHAERSRGRRGRAPPGAPGPSAARARRAPDLHYGPLVRFTLASAERAQSFLAGLELVAEATSFGGVHSTAERRARRGTDDVAPGFIRFSAGCEDAADLLADVERALAS